MVAVGVQLFVCVCLSVADLSLASSAAACLPSSSWRPVHHPAGLGVWAASGLVCPVWCAPARRRLLQPLGALLRRRAFYRSCCDAAHPGCTGIWARCTHAAACHSLNQSGPALPWASRGLCVSMPVIYSFCIQPGLCGAVAYTHPQTCRCVAPLPLTHVLVL